MNTLQRIFRKMKFCLRALLRLPCGDDAELFYRINRLPAVLPAGFQFRFPWGLVEFVSARDLRGQFCEIFVQRHYAFHTSVEAPVIIDAGGNIGMSAIWFRQNYPGSQLTVYEADPAIFELLTRNLAAAGISGVDAVNVAVWTHDDGVSFDNLGQDKGAVTATGGGIPVRSVDLAVHLPSRVDLLKLDVEGAEYPILERLCATGAIARVQNLVAEFHITRGDMDRALGVLALLRQAGMQVTFTSALGSWLGNADSASSFEIVGRQQVLAEVYAWR